MRQKIIWQLTAENSEKTTRVFILREKLLIYAFAPTVNGRCMMKRFSKSLLRFLHRCQASEIPHYRRSGFHRGTTIMGSYLFDGSLMSKYKFLGSGVETKEEHGNQGNCSTCNEYQI